jgi:hypothetical protein
MLKPAYNFRVHDVGIFDDLHGVGKTAWLNSGIDKPKNLRLRRRSIAFRPRCLCCGIVKKHACIDGNKHTVFLSVRVFLFLNGQHASQRK